jgi:hypothetical protein
VLGLTCAATAVLTGAAFVGALLLRRRMTAVDAELRPLEASTGVCGTCDGKGFRIDNYGKGPAPATCYRCGGTGKAPA